MPVAQSQAGVVGPDCTFNGKKLYGKFQVVKNFPDIKVQVVKNFPDLKVQTVKNFPDSCGKWQFTESFPDVKIQYVENFPDIKIQMVNNFPGVNWFSKVNADFSERASSKFSEFSIYITNLAS